MISSNFLHISDQIMSELPFAKKTDMFDAIKMADAKASDVDSFLATLLAEHDAVRARAQMKTLLIEHVRALLEEAEDAQWAHWAPEQGRGGCWRGVFVRGPLPAG
jgi:hypothetical protein